MSEYIVGGIRERESSVSAEFISDDGEVKKIRLTSKLWERYSLSAGDVIGGDLYDEISELGERCEAVTRAVKILSSSVCSVSSLEQKLRRAGYSSESARYAVNVILKKGFIDEDGDAERLAFSSASKNRRGASRIEKDLMARGYSRETSRRAASSVPCEVYDRALSEFMVRKCAGADLSDVKERDRIIASAIRSGFGMGKILSEIKKLSDDSERD